MAQIQTEVARLQVMADDLFAIFSDSKIAENMAKATVPNIEVLRAKARRELYFEEGLSQETYDALSAAMTSGENLAWDIYENTESEEQRAAAKLVCRQFDNIHIMMNAIEGVPVPEGHKCWPPEDPNCP